MKNKKYELNLFSFYDYAGMEEHFEQMALKGWMIETKKFVFNIYRKIEPKKIKFNISYAQKVIDEYNPKMDDELGEFRDLVEYSGWKFAFEYGGMEGFYAEDTVDEAVETDPSIMIETVDKKMKTAWFLIFTCFFVMSISIYTNISANFIKNPIAFLSDYWGLHDIILETIIVIYTVCLASDYYIWKKRALLRSTQGEFAHKSSKLLKIITYLLIIIAIVNLIVAFVQAIYFGFTAKMIKFILTIVVIFIGLKISNIYRDKMKEKNLDIDKIRSKSLALNLAIVVFFSSMFGALFNSDDVNIESMPYKVEDFRGESASDLFPIESRDSFFSSQRVLGQSNEEGEPELWFYYDEVTVHMLFLYEPYKKRILGENADYKVVSDLSWGANKVYYNSKNGRKFYILFYDNKILKMNFSWDVTDEQKAKIRQKTMG